MSSAPVPTPPVLDPAEFRQAVGRFATGVTVVTTRADGVDHAMTANAFTSVSLDPLLVLVCVEKVTRFHDAVMASGEWAVSVLGEDARDASVWFATRGRPLRDQIGRFPHVRGEATGAAVLSGSLAWLECRTVSVHDGGDHSIVLGDVLSVGSEPTATGPLLYYASGYRGLAP